MWTFICKKLAFENITFVDSLSGIRSPDSSKLAKNLKNDNNVAIFQHDVNVNFFWHCFVSNVNFGYWSKFHVNIITGSGIMTTFFYKGLIRNPEIRNTPVWVFPNIWRLGWGMDTQFGTNVCNKMLLNAAKFQGYSFYRFWVIKENPTGKGVKLPPPRLGLNLTNNESPQVLLKRFCLDNNCWLFNIKIFRTTFYQSTSQQLKAAKISTK